ncbi:MAG: TetR/AcrR family transcriptional regulator [Acidimicrobiales bacterium]
MGDTVAGGTRARVRAELTRDLLRIARQHLAAEGAASLSLRVVARDAGMVSSAIYRYFPSRDDLLTALIVDGFEQVAAVIEAADRTLPRRDVRGRWRAIGRAVRRWAIEHPHEYGLLYGTPIPGYRAPEATAAPVRRAAETMLGLLADAVAHGAVRRDLAPLGEGARLALEPLQAAAPGVRAPLLAAGLLAWTALFGHVSFELFGHLHNVVADAADADRDAFFDHQLDLLADLLFAGAAR